MPCVCEEVLDRVGLELLDAERQALVLGVDLEDHGLDLVALVQHLAGMLDALGPRQIRDVHQAVDALLDLDERAEVGEVAHDALDPVPDAVLAADQVPRDWARSA